MSETPEMQLSPWQADRRRYPAHPWFSERSLWAIAVYRFGRWNDARPPGVTRWCFDKAYWLLFRVTEIATGISLSKSVEVGPGLRIWHGGTIVIHSDARIGAHCTLRHGITIGNRSEGGPVPVIEDDVELGAYAQVLGAVRVGRGARIGALTLVLSDVPAGATAVGVPARIARSQGANGRTPAHSDPV